MLYNPDDEQLRFLCRWKSTLLPMVATDPLFWFLLVTHVGLLMKQRALLHEGEPGLPTLEWKAALVPTSLLTFFVVFYVSNCYERFFQLFGCCVRIGGCMTEWAYLLRTHFGDADKGSQWNMMRLLLGAMHIHYAFVADDDDTPNTKTISSEEWEEIKQKHYLSSDEVDLLIPVSHGSRFLMPVIWALNEVKAGLLLKLQEHQQRSDLTHSDLLADPGMMVVYSSFEAIALTFRRNCSETLEVLNMPVPFAYFHATKLLLLSSLSIVSYSLVQLVEHEDQSLGSLAISLAVFTVISGIMIGLQSIAVSMADPFGDDDTDFNVDAFMGTAYQTVVELLRDQNPPMRSRMPPKIPNPLLHSATPPSSTLTSMLTSASSSPSPTAAAYSLTNGMPAYTSTATGALDRTASAAHASLLQHSSPQSAYDRSSRLPASTTAAVRSYMPLPSWVDRGNGSPGRGRLWGSGMLSGKP